MKVALKYIWSLAVIPFLIFLKGDLSMDTFMHINKIEPIEKTKEKIMENFHPEPKPFFEINVKAITKSGNFTADGIPVNLYDSSYNLVCQSQVVLGKVKFQLEDLTQMKNSYHIVVPKTADQLEICSGVISSPLLIFEDHMKEEAVYNR